MEVAPINLERKKSLPGVIGYIVKNDDTLWSIANRHLPTLGVAVASQSLLTPPL